MAILELNIRGKTYEVNVTTGGMFQAQLDGANVSSPTFEGLRERLMKATKKLRPEMAIAFVHFDDGKLRHGICNGRHANGNYLVRYDAGKSEQVANWALTDCVKPEDADEYEKLCIASRAASAAVTKFNKERGINVRKLVDEALDGDA